MSDRAVPSEGTASSPGAIADELADALLAFDRVDYNALAVTELRDLLDARETIEGLCLEHRRVQRNRSEAGGDGDA